MDWPIQPRRDLVSFSFRNRGGRMSLTRRAFFRTTGAAGVGLVASDLIGARGREASAATLETLETLPGAAFPQGAAAKRLIKIASNENAYGPGPAALEAVRGLVGPASGRYPMNVPELASAIAKHFSVDPKNVLIGTGSTEIISAAVHAFTSP